MAYGGLISFNFRVYQVECPICGAGNSFEGSGFELTKDGILHSVTHAHVIDKKDEATHPCYMIIHARWKEMRARRLARNAEKKAALDAARAATKARMRGLCG